MRTRVALMACVVGLVAAFRIGAAYLFGAR